MRGTKTQKPKQEAETTILTNAVKLGTIEPRREQPLDTKTGRIHADGFCCLGCPLCGLRSGTCVCVCVCVFICLCACVFVYSFVCSLVCLFLPSFLPPFLPSLLTYLLSYFRRLFVEGKKLERRYSNHCTAAWVAGASASNASHLTPPT